VNTRRSEGIEPGAEGAPLTGVPDLSVALGPIALEHPLVDASGTFDLLEYARRYDGDYFADFPYAAYVPKTVTADARIGNPAPRVTETPAGMINAIGLENPGVHAWTNGLAEWASLRQPVIVSVGGNEPGQYAAVVAALEEHLAAAEPGTCPSIQGYELNISCPNVSSGLQIGADPGATAEVLAACRAVTGRLLLAKLTPNVRDVTEIGAAALGAGADGLSLVNTFKALVLHRDSLKPFLGNRTGGLCGPAIKPIALRMVAEVAQAFPTTPIVGMGGVMTGLDALEFIACGASAVAVGAANFTAFEAPRRILAELRDELQARGFTSVSEARGVGVRPFTLFSLVGDAGKGRPGGASDGVGLLKPPRGITYTLARCPPLPSSSTRPRRGRSTSAWTPWARPTRSVAGAPRSRPTSSTAT
jgi:dihydroorotate dehydrogenase (NAD+) catalytic subunit